MIQSVVTIVARRIAARLPDASIALVAPIRPIAGPAAALNLMT
ncbi:MAG: hypothetical protein ABF292_03525 [Desulfobacterales bacterium]